MREHDAFGKPGGATGVHQDEHRVLVETDLGKTDGEVGSRKEWKALPESLTVNLEARVEVGSFCLPIVATIVLDLKSCTHKRHCTFDSERQNLLQ